MADQLIFYTHPMSRGRIVRWMLEEIGQPYRTELLDYDTTMKAAAYLAINPMGKVPAIRHGDIVVTEAAAICAYLADVFPEARLTPPAGDRLRGPYYRWLFFAAGPVEAAWTNKAMGFVVPQGRERMMGSGRRSRASQLSEAAAPGPRNSTKFSLMGQKFLSFNGLPYHSDFPLIKISVPTDSGAFRSIASSTRWDRLVFDHLQQNWNHRTGVPKEPVGSLGSLAGPGKVEGAATAPAREPDQVRRRPGRRVPG